MRVQANPLAPADDEGADLSRFGLRVLFYVTAVIAAAIALFGVGGIFWAGVVLGYWLLRIRGIKKQRQRLGTASEIGVKSGFTVVELLVAIVIVGILIGMVLPAVTRHSPYHSAKILHRNAMRQISLDGNPMHSWRVLILPFLGEQKLFEQYDFDEPWDGPNNSKLASKLETDPFNGVLRTTFNGLTGFKLVTGPETAFVKDQTVGFEALEAGSTNTICFVYDNSKPVNWMSPEDVAIDDAVNLFDRNNRDACPSRVSENKFQKTTYYFSCLALFDGSVEHAGLLRNPSELREYFTVSSSREKKCLYELDFEFPGIERETKPEGYILVVINLALAFLPSFWFRKKIC